MYLYSAVAVIIIVLIGHYRPVRQPFSRYLMFGLAALLSIGQCLPGTDLIYPFVRWAMYSSPSPSTEYRDYLFSEEAGGGGRYPFGNVVFSSPWPMQARLDQMILSCRCTQGDELLDRAIDGLAAIHLLRTGQTILRFEVVSVSVRQDRPSGQPRRLYSWKATTRRHGFPLSNR